MTTDIHHILFSVIRVGMNHEMPFPSLSYGDCKTLIQIGAKQSILPIIHRGLKEAGAPAEVVEECDKVRLKDTRQYIIQNDALQKIGSEKNSITICYCVGVPILGNPVAVLK